MVTATTLLVSVEFTSLRRLASDTQQLDSQFSRECADLSPTSLQDPTEIDENDWFGFHLS
jgi:hypothetical protein